MLFAFNFAALFDAKLSSVLLQLGTLPESERHLILCVKYTYQATLPKTINVRFIINVSLLYFMYST